MVRPKNGRAANTKVDQQFFLDFELELEPIEPDPNLPPNPAKWKWTGDLEDIGSYWQIPDTERRCTATAYVRDADGGWVLDREGNRLRRPCTGWPIKGGKVCPTHGGGNAVVRFAVMERMLAAADKMAGVIIAIAIDPNLEPKVRLQAANSILDRLGLKGGVAVSEEAQPYESLLRRWAENGIEDYLNETAPPALKAKRPANEAG